MQIKNQDVNKCIERIGDHYRNNIANRHVRKALLSADIPPGNWEKIDALTTKSEYYKVNGYLLDDLYEMILAISRLVFQVRTRVMPNLRSILSRGFITPVARKGASSSEDSVLRNLAATNFPVNIGILSDQINELYVKVTTLDREVHKKTAPTYEKIPELKELGRYLISS